MSRFTFWTCNRMGVEQIADILEGREDLLSVHIFSHGDSGVLNLGSGQMTSETIAGRHADALALIGHRAGGGWGHSDLWL